MLVATMVVRLHFDLYAVFWLLEITSYVPELYSHREAKDIFSTMMMTSLVFSAVWSPLIGYVVDKINPRVILPIPFLVRAFGLYLYIQNDDPSSLYAMLSAIVIVFGFIFELITVEAIFLRNLDKEIRGLAVGTNTMVGILSQFILALLGGRLYDSMGPKAPFWYVLVADLLFVVVVVIFGGLLGWIKNDIRRD